MIKEWKIEQDKYLEETETTFHPLPLKKLRRFPTDIGEVRNFIPLPAIAQIMSLEKAKLLNGELHIYFIDERWKQEK